METNSLGVRKGTWTKEEDILLKNCIDKYGEGKWHQVPLRAGLNRCRKSCRLRWLNYLRPNIKRGCFTKDELDLIIRLHKLLGNKWSLIAGRLPGRTANDVKNFWNTHVEKRLSFGQETRTTTNNNNINIINNNNNNNNNQKTKTFTNSNIIRPRPRTFKNLIHMNRPVEIIRRDESPDNKQKQYSDEASSSQEKAADDDCVQWWSKLLEFTEKVESGNVTSSEEGKQIRERPSSGWGDGMSSFSLEELDVSLEELDVWELLNFEER